MPYTTELATRAGVKRLNDKQQGTLKRGLMRRSIRMIRSSISLSGGKNKKPAIFEPDTVPQVFDQALFLEKLKEHQAGNNSITYEIWDFGGEKVLQNFNDLFLTQNSVCICVFDMREVLNDNRGEYCKTILNWLNRISVHAPDSPIILCGSYLDKIKLKKEWDKINKTLNKRLKLAENFENVPKIDGRWFLPVSNTRNKNAFVHLRKEVNRVTFQQKFIKEPVSMRWTKVLDDLMEERGKAWVSLLDVYKIGTINGLRNSEIDVMLRFFSDTGVLVYLSSTEVLRSMVILEPQWLTNQLGKVIRNREVHALSENESDAKAIQESGYEKFLVSGFASHNLLSCLWKDKQTTDFMMELMRHTLLMSDWNEYFIIPCMNMNIESNINIGKGPKCSFCFSGSILPDEVFHRLVCLCVDYSSYIYGAKEPLIGGNQAKVWFGASDVICLQKIDDRIGLVVETDNECSLSVYRCLRMMKAMLGKINEDFMNGELSWYMEFEKGISYENARKNKKLQKWFAEEKRQQKEVAISVRDVDLQIFLENLRGVQVI
eukprot:CAMPEP_0204874918 /NCGR_PEP_ID=MMETSP1348-20121228/44457_1 /ASSEMBLY_ACC=CAM_ASM_000700 /TAXON_ID=215587 /ORGANISM="Aplanochytrium stocchinoi, Strain GSBS06" /LENGTH=544 /DNA_ID=CAMNT_0052031037 /DNA_START=1 /DNA_END=1635 /DNA_ORIENTATION=+